MKLQQLMMAVVLCAATVLAVRAGWNSLNRLSGNQRPVPAADVLQADYLTLDRPGQTYRTSASDDETVRILNDWTYTRTSRFSRFH